MSIPMPSIPSIGFLQRLVLVAACGTLGGALLVRFVGPARLEALRSVEPTHRLRRLLFWTALPVLTGGIVLLAGLLPSWMHHLGITADHCHGPSGHVRQLCLLHLGHLRTASTVAWGLLALGAGWLLYFWARDVREAYRSHRARRQLLEVAEPHDSPPHHRVSTHQPIAVTMGWLRPRMFLSDSLYEQLDEAHLEAVLTHERAHVSKYHGMICGVARLLGRCHTPALHSRLLEEIELACEQIADRRAAETLDGAIPVAEALVEVERLSHASPPLETHSLAFEGTRLERRIRDLLENEWQSPRSGPIAILFSSMLLLPALSMPLHWGLEMGLGMLW